MESDTARQQAELLRGLIKTTVEQRLMAELAVERSTRLVPFDGELRLSLTDARTAVQQMLDRLIDRATAEADD